jgi:hypothetical protein
MSPSHTSQDAGREPSVRVVRRQLITAHGAKEMPTPRVVLHLPDLDALQTVALGPVRSGGSRRRIDSAHDVEPTAKRTTRKQEAKKGEDSEKAELPATPLLNLLRVPLKKWLTTEGAGKLTAGSLVVLMQQPKVMLGAIVALGMQLAAILAMLGGGTADKSANSPTPAGDVAHSHSHGSHGPEPRISPAPKPADQHAAHDRRPIQTPLNAVTADGKPFAGPSLLPAPQALSGIDPKDLPPWQAPVTNLPAPTRNATIAAPSPSAAPALAGPNLAGPGLTGAADGSSSFTAPASPGTGNVAIGLPEASSPSVSNTSNPSTSGPTNVVQTSGARVKLKGTIRKPSGAN